MLAVRHDDRVTFDRVRPPEEKQNKSEDDDGEEKTSHDRQ